MVWVGWITLYEYTFIQLHSITLNCITWITWLMFFSYKRWSTKLPSFLYIKESILSRSKEYLPLGILPLVTAGNLKHSELLPPIIQYLLVERCHARKKGVLLSIYTIPKPWSNIIYLLLFVKYFCVLSFAHLRLTTWLDVSWSYLPSVQGAECHNESREMSPHQF